MADPGFPHECLPWHQVAERQLKEAVDNNRLPHAILLRGSAGLGKDHFARLVARKLLCQAGAFSSCGQCKTCALLDSGNHPDIFRLAPEEDKKQIRVEQVRELVSRLSLTSQMGSYKVVIIEPAESMNTNAQNSLLKTLEEPPALTVMLLVSHNSAGLAATIRSRCQTLRFNTPPAEQALEWLGQQAEADWPVLLQLAWGAPLAALTFARHDAGAMGDQLAGELQALIDGRMDPVSTAESWAGDQPLIRMRWLQQQVYGVIQWRILGQAPELVHKTLQRSLQNRIAELSLTESFRYLDRLQFVIGQADRAINQTLAILPVLSVWADGPHFEQIVTDSI